MEKNMTKTVDNERRTIYLYRERYSSKKCTDKLEKYFD